MSDYTWIPVFQGISDWIADYEHRQEELVQILRDIGVDKGLEDERADNTKVPLKVIDPFTFFATFMKYGFSKRIELFTTLLQRISLPLTPPSDFNGVPNAQPLKVWLFPYEKERSPDMVSNLWALFHQMRLGKIDGDLFNKILKIPHTGFAKITECLFYLAPEKYFPVDAQTKPWLKKIGREPPKENWASYQDLLAWLSTTIQKSFYEISYEAWSENQNNKFSAAKETLIMENEEEKSKANHISLNQILYGPPGTGKTYSTLKYAVSLADPIWYANLKSQKLDSENQRKEVKKRYEMLCQDKRIAFTTFHQSFSYEDFIEGIRAETSDENQGINYTIEKGIFKEIADHAAKSVIGKPFGLSDSPNIWKISIGRTHEKEMRDCYINAGEARIGWNKTGDLSQDFSQRTSEQQKYWESLTKPNHNALNAFSHEIRIGDVVLCLKNAKTVQAVGVVTSDYSFDATIADSSEYSHVRKVNWLLKDINLNILSLNESTRMVQQTVYLLYRINWHSLIAELSRQHIALPTSLHDKHDGRDRQNYVLIIDEINRGNISRIFGELITLLEPDKRKNTFDERSVILPYSKEAFTVPDNLYVIGTMNSADKSLTQLDLALRRRFEFIEFMPQPQLLTGTSVFGIDIGDLLTVMNQRIEILLDRDHTLGHAYFWPLKRARSENEKINLLAEIFAKRIIPLLQEYFFADWERIGWVLNDPDKAPEHRFIHTNNIEQALGDLFPNTIASQLKDRRYRINHNAFKNPAAYRGIIPKSATTNS